MLVESNERMLDPLVNVYGKLHNCVCITFFVEIQVVNLYMNTEH